MANEFFKLYIQNLEEELGKLQPNFGQDLLNNSNSLLSTLAVTTADYIQKVADASNIITGSIDLKTASATNLDRAVSLKGMQRLESLRTRILVNITTSIDFILQGLNKDIAQLTQTELSNSGAFSVKDSSGNVYYLINDTSFIANTSQEVEFVAEEEEALNPSIGSIESNNINVAEVIAIDMTKAPVLVGKPAETDGELRARAENATIVSDNEKLEVIRARIGNTQGMNDSAVYENDTNGTQVVQKIVIPSHSLAYVFDSQLSNQELGGLVVSTKPNGIGSVGDEVYVANGNTYRFFRVSVVPLFVQATLQQDDTNTTFDKNAIANYVATNFNKKIGISTTVNDIQDIFYSALQNTNSGKGIIQDIKIATSQADLQNSTNLILQLAGNEKFILGAQNITINIINS